MESVTAELHQATGKLPTITPAVSPLHTSPADIGPSSQNVARDVGGLIGQASYARPSAAYFDAADHATEHAVMTALKEVPHNATADLFADALYFSAKTNAICVNLVTHLAAVTGISAAQFGEMLIDGLKTRSEGSTELDQLRGRVVRLSTDFQKALLALKAKNQESVDKDKDIQALRAELQRREAAFRGEIDRLQARLSSAESNLNASHAEHARTVKVFSENLDAVQRELQLVRDQAEQKSADMLKMQTFLDEQVPALCREAHVECKKALLRKIVARYPDADMKYFSNLAVVPEDVPIMDEWLVIPEEADQDVGRLGEGGPGSGPDNE